MAMKNKIKDMILELCTGKEWDWKGHIESVVKYSKLLAKKLHADEDICEISAWLHDIEKIKGKREDHHIHGAEEAERILKKLNYPQERIAKVKHCILAHSSHSSHSPQTLEAKIVASADALSHFDRFLDFSYLVYHSRGLSIEEGRAWLIKKYKSSWKKAQLIPEAGRIAKPKYEAIKRILSVN